MSNTIERNVVEMQFDNSNFEKNVKTSIGTLDRLKEALNFKGSENSLLNLSRVASGFKMDGVANAAQVVSDKFSSLEYIAIGALTRIGQRAVDTGERLVKSVSIDQITAGWDKYGKKTTSVATLVSQGYDIDTVEKELEKLNWFTDETSYNFTDMVDNISKFTASGQKLEDANQAMMGIATWAALSGQNATTASRAMYQLSQAISFGVMRKEDWRSIQTANMDTQEFRQKALDAAVAAGTLKKNADGTYQSLVATGKAAEKFDINKFTEKLTDGAWFTDKVMMDVYKQYASVVSAMEDFSVQNNITASQIFEAKDKYEEGAQAFSDYCKELGLTSELTKELQDIVHNLDEFGIKAFKAAQEARTFADVIDSIKDAVSTSWMNIFQTIFGNSEDATKLWTEMAEYFYEVFATPINELGGIINEWIEGLENGRDDIFQIFRNLATVVEKIVGPIKEAFGFVFPPATAEEFNRFIQKCKELALTFELNEEEQENLKQTFIGLFNVVKTGLSILGAIIKTASPLLGIIKKLASNILSIAGNSGKALTKLTEGFNNVGDAADVVKKIIEDLESNFSLIINGFNTFRDNSREFRNDFERNFSAVKDILTGFAYSFIDILSDLSGYDLSGFKEKWDNFINSIHDKLLIFINNFENAGGGLKGALSAIMFQIKYFIKFIFDKFKELTGVDLSFLLMKINTAIEKVRVTLVGLVDQFTNLDDANSKISKLKNTFDSLKNKIIEVKDAIVDFFSSIINKIKENPILFSNIAIQGAGLLGFIDIIRNLTKGEGLGGIVKLWDVMDAITDSLETLQNNLNSKTLMNIALAIGVLALAMLLFSSIDGEKVSTTAGLFTTAVIELLGSMKALTSMTKLNFSPKMAASLATIMISLSIAISIIAGAMSKLTAIDSFGDAIGALVFTFAAIVELLGSVLVMKVMIDQLHITDSDTKKIAKLGLFLWAIAKAVNSMAEATVNISSIDNWVDQLTSVLYTLLELAGLVAAGKILGTYVKDNMAQTGIGLLLMAEGVKILSEALLTLVGLKPEEALQGIVTLGIIMKELTESINSLGNKKSVLATCTTLISYAIAIGMLVKAVTKLSELEFGKMMQGALGLSIITILFSTIANTLKTSGKEILSGGTGLFMLALGLGVVALALSKMSQIPIENLVESSIVLISLIFICSELAKQASGSIEGAGAILMLAGSLLVISFALKTLSSLSFGEIIKSLIGLAGALALLWVALVAFSSVEAATLPGAGALLMMAGALLALAVSLKVLSSLSFKQIATGLIALAAGLAILFVAGIAFGAVAAQILVGAVAIIAILAAIGVGFLVLGAGIAVVALSISLFAVNLASLIEALGIVVEFVNANSAALVEMEVVIAALAVVFGALGLASGILGIGLMTAGAGFVTAGLGLLVLSVGLLAAGAAMTVFADGLYKILDVLYPGEYELSKFAAESTKTTEQVTNNLKKTEAGFNSSGANSINGYIMGMNSKRGAAIQTAINIGKAAWMAMRAFLKIKSPSRLLAEDGKYFDEGFAMGMENNVGKVEDSAKSVGESAKNTLSTAISTAYDNLTSGIDDPVIKPVLDLSEIQNGSSEINSMFGKDYASDISATYRSNKQVSEDQSAANASMLSGLNNQLIAAMNENGAGSLPIQVNVTLAGDAEGLFRVILNENTRLTKMNGSNPMLA